MRDNLELLEDIDDAHREHKDLGIETIDYHYVRYRTHDGYEFDSQFEAIQHLREKKHDALLADR